MVESSQESVGVRDLIQRGLADVDYVRPYPRGREFDERAVGNLPPDLTFLAREGVAPDRLIAARGAARSGVLAHEALLAEGWIGEEEYYRALARSMRCEYFGGDIAFGDDLDPVRALRCGVAPLRRNERGLRAVIAPRGRAVALLIEATQAGRFDTRQFAIASPQRYAALLRARYGRIFAREAAGQLASEFSAEGGLVVAQICELVCAGLLICFAAFISLALVRALFTIWLWLIFAAAIVLRSVAVVSGGPTPRPGLLSDEKLPVYSIIVPLYREARVVADLIAAIDALDYPRSKLDIKLVVERSDGETLQSIARMGLPARYEVIVAPPGKPTTKPRALNLALPAIRGEHVVIFDAEDAPSPGQLRLAASRFAADEDVDCLQARLTVSNADESWLSRLFALEYSVLFDLVNPGLCALDLPVALGGTSNHFRVRALRAVGGWDAWNVAEDADLGLRLARFGYRVGALDSDTSEEAPHEFGNWFRQRVRWQKGWMQTCIVHSRRPIEAMRDLGFRRALAAFALIGAGVLGNLFGPAFALDTVWRAVSSASGEFPPWRETMDVTTYLLALSGAQAIVLPAIVAARRRHMKLSAGVFLALPIYYLLISLASWTALAELLFRPFYWAKTAHGRSRIATRPSGLRLDAAARFAD